MFLVLPTNNENYGDSQRKLVFIAASGILYPQNLGTTYIREISTGFMYGRANEKYLEFASVIR